MRCQRCQQEWPDEFEFCPKCGVSLEGVQATKGSAAATGRAAAVVGDKNVVIPGQVGGSVTVRYGPEGPDPESLRLAYLCRIQGECGRLPLRGVDLEASDATRAAQPLNLANVYVELDTTLQVPASLDSEEVVSALLNLSTEYQLHDMALVSARTLPDGEGVGEKKLRHITSLECAAHFRQMVLLGDPGGGVRPASCWYECLPQAVTVASL